MDEECAWQLWDSLCVKDAAASRRTMSSTADLGWFTQVWKATPFSSSTGTGAQSKHQDPARRPPSPFPELTQEFRQLIPHLLTDHNGNSENRASLPSFSDCRPDGQQQPQGIINLLENEISGQDCKQTVQWKSIQFEECLQSSVLSSCCRRQSHPAALSPALFSLSSTESTLNLLHS